MTVLEAGSGLTRSAEGLAELGERYGALNLDII